jgi:putative sterol carrier protein
MAKFPSPEWTTALMEKLNSDGKYAQIARNWEGDLVFDIQPGGPIGEKIVIYLDLWHGTCRQATYGKDLTGMKPAFLLKAPYENFVRVLKGELHPMQAMLTRKLQVHGNMALMMRNVPTVLDFVRCAQEVTDEVI